MLSSSLLQPTLFLRPLNSSLLHSQRNLISSTMAASFDFLTQKPYNPPSWAHHLHPIPSHIYSLAQLPTPIHKWNLPNLPKDIELWIKRDDLSGMQLSGNKVRKLEFLMADAVKQGADCIVTIGGIQSNHCRATAVAAKYLNLDCYLILRTSKILADKDPGLTGNLLVERLVGAHVDLVSKEEYSKIGSEVLTNLLKERLISEGRRPYVIPVGGSNSLGTWGYIEAIREIEEQLRGAPNMVFHDIAVACGSGGTIAGLSLGSSLSNLKAKVHAFSVCDNPDYFYNYAQGLLDGLHAGVSSRDIVDVQDLGMGSAVETLCGQAYGARKYDMLGVYVQRSTILLMLTGIPLAIIYIFSKPLLILLGQSPEIASAAAIFVYGLIPQIFAYAANFPISKFMQSQSIVAPSAYISAVIFVVHVILSYFLVYKIGLGLLGASLMLSISWWLVVGGQFLYIKMSDRCKYTWTGFTMEAFSGLPGFFKLSAASAVMLCLETWYFQVLVLIAGLLKDPEIALDSLSVCMTISGWIYMIAVGFNAAASVRVSNELGARNPKSAAFSVIVVTGLSCLISIIIGVIVIALRHVISYAFTEGEVVANAVSELTPLLAITLILNGIQPVLSGVAVGCGWQAFVAYVNVGCYYVVGVPLGVLFGFYFDFGAKGIWSGMIGGTFLQTVILTWVTLRTDWDKEVDEAAKRLNKWGDKKAEAIVQN